MSGMAKGPLTAQSFSMRAALLRRPTRTHDAPLSIELVDVPRPAIGEHDVLIRVSVCAVCRTDLDVAEGRVVASHYPVVPGHQVVGEIEAIGASVVERAVGDRVGVAWIRWACGECRWCRAGEENLCPRFQSNGCDGDGGYAEYVAAPAAFTLPIPAALHDKQAAPLLCAGAIGWRSLRLAGIREGDALGLTGFGASAHLVLPLARHRYPNSPIYVFARNSDERDFARTLGAAWAGDTAEEPPTPLGAIIDTTPAWKPVVEAMSKLMPGGRLVINAIRKNDADRAELLRIDYATDLWREREIKSVANVTRRDVREVLDVAAELNLQPTIETRPLAEAGLALERIRTGGGIRGATVLSIRP
jgi:propanol-preferring alcohol dehydrogenase